MVSLTNRVTFNFKDDFDYQLKAIDSVVKLFTGLPKQPTGIYQNVRKIKKITEGDPVRNPDITEGKRLLDNLRAIQLENQLFADNEVEGNNFTVEMETGTGKTYVYLRSILELHQKYRFTKFIIVVPSIAIRKGVEKSIQMLKDHFKPDYNIDIEKHSFVYDSKNPDLISTKLVATKDLSICIMNIQAFNKDTNKIRQEDERGRILWEDIKYIRPIVIIDEPQKIEGTATRKSKSLKAIDDISPLFTLRYSATHKQLYNQIYKLDSYDAFKQDLVKKIEVKTVHAVIPKDTQFIRYVKFTSDLKARIEIFSQEQGGYIKFKKFDVRGGASLYELSGGLSQYRNYRIQEDPHKLKPLKIANGNDVFELAVERSTNEFAPNEVIRIQIRLAIKSHLEKQFAILDEGHKIKLLSLFFIDSVVKVRDPDQPDGRGEYLKIFDEEYFNIIEEPTFKKQFEKYKQLFTEYHDIQKVREGYFARDKKNQSVDIEDWDSSINIDEIKVKAKSQEDIDRGIELILDKKDELISFHEPLAFIFSHSALREGWDNPNVFTICTLKSGGSDIAKKQEIGRGLRLPVDIEGNQIRDNSINELTIIANDTYDHFAELLQKDFNESIAFNKDEVTAEVLIQTLKEAKIPEDKITPELVNIFKEELKSKGIISANNTLTKKAMEIKVIEFSNETLNQHASGIFEKFAKYMTEKGSKKIPIKNGNNEAPKNEQHNYLSEDDFMKLFETLSEKLEKRSIYKVNIDKDKFIQDCSEELNEYLKYMGLTNKYLIEQGKNDFTEMKQMELNKIRETSVEEDILDYFEEKSEFELVNYIMHHTMLPRLAIVKIIRAIDKKELLNSQDILDQVTKKILDKFKRAKAEKLYAYEVIEGYKLDHGEIFALDKIIDEQEFEKETAIYKTKANKRKAVNKYYKMDSDGEYKFAEKLEENPNVLLFTKLKKGGFIIDTPYGNYSPDWAVVYKKEDNHTGLYFIVETKIDKKEQDLSDVEKLKIKCGIKHFEAVSKDITFDWVSDFEDFKRKFGVRETV